MEARNSRRKSDSFFEFRLRVWQFIQARIRLAQRFMDLGILRRDPRRIQEERQRVAGPVLLNIHFAQIEERLGISRRSRRL